MLDATALVCRQTNTRTHGRRIFCRRLDQCASAAFWGNGGQLSVNSTATETRSFASQTPPCAGVVQSQLHARSSRRAAYNHAGCPPVFGVAADWGLVDTHRRSGVPAQDSAPIPFQIKWMIFQNYCFMVYRCHTYEASRAQKSWHGHFWAKN